MDSEESFSLALGNFRPPVYDEQLLEGSETQPSNNSWSDKIFSLSKRYVIAVLCSLGMANAFALRANLSVALVAMVSNSTRYHDGKWIQEDAEFKWNTRIQGVILGSFFYGYIITQLPGGYLAKIYGGASLLGLSLLLTSIFTLFIPLAARAHVGLLITLRIIVGMCEGLAWPAIMTFWSHWAPPLERSRLLAITVCGQFIGTILSMTLSGVIARDLGWPAVFYIFGSVGLIWSIAWLILVRNSPAEDRWLLAQDEKDYITTKLKEIDTTATDTPWRSILTSKRVWVLAFTFWCEAWCIYTLLTELPSYLKHRLGFHIDQSGFLAAVPFLVLAISCNVFAVLADALLKTRILNVTALRKLFTAAGYFGQAIFLIVLGFTSNWIVAILCLVLATAAGGLGYSGFFVSHLDIAGQHAGILHGLTNTVATSAGILSPLLTGYIVQHHSADEWRAVFLIAASLYIVGGTVFAIFGTAVIQPWALAPWQRERQEVDPEREQIWPERESLERD